METENKEYAKRFAGNIYQGTGQIQDAERLAKEVEEFLNLPIHST